jgi:hypothetical protein
MRPRTLLALALLSVLALVLTFAPAPARAQEQATNANAARIQQMLTQSGLQFTRHRDTVWSLKFNGKSLAEFRVILAVKGELLVTFTNPVRKAQIPLTSDFLFKLARFNHTLDYVKVGLDDDGDLFVRTDSNPRALDLAEFKAMISQVSAATDEVYSSVNPLLLKP